MTGRMRSTHLSYGLSVAAGKKHIVGRMNRMEAPRL